MSKVPLISMVDDDAMARDGISELVESLGYRAVTFSSAEDFLRSDVIAETTCLITDVQMPGLNGLELQEALQSLGHQTPVIVITAYPNGETSDPCARKRSGRLPEQTVRRTNADRMPDGCDQIAIIPGVAATHSCKQ
jgi:DNA-binding NtrC family response regulator